MIYLCIMRECDKEFEELIKLCTPGDIEEIKRVFRVQAVNASMDKYYPEWCDAVEFLPDTGKLLGLNVMAVEVTCDVVSSVLISRGRSI